MGARLLLVVAALLGASGAGLLDAYHDNRPLPYRVIQEAPNAPIMLSIPGNGGWNYMSRTLAAELGITNAYTLVTYDMRGIGDTDEEPPTEWETNVADGLDILRKLVAVYKQPVVLLGYSTGTIVALRMATRAPRDVRYVITMGLLPDNDAATMEARKTSMWDNMWLPGWAVDGLVSSASNRAVITLGGLNEMNANGGVLGNFKMLSSEGMGGVAPSDRPTQKQFGEAMKAIAPIEIHMNRIVLECPLYIIQGMKDTMGLAAAIPRAVETIRAPRKRIFWIKDAGHVPHLSSPQGVRDAIRTIAALPPWNASA